MLRYRRPMSDVLSPVLTALSLGEIDWARRCALQAVKAARKSGRETYLAALRASAELESTYADDGHSPDLARAAKAWRAVVEGAEPDARDLERLAWAELMVASVKKARAALESAIAREATLEVGCLRASVAWLSERTDAKRLSLVHAEAARLAERSDFARLELAVRLLLQGDACPVSLVDALAEGRLRDAPAFAPEVARAVAFRLAAHHGASAADAGRSSSAIEAIRVAWENEVIRLVPDPEDPRRHVLDHVTASAPGAVDVERARRRVSRVTKHFGASSPALELPLSALAWTAKQAGDFVQVVEALERLDELRQSAKTADALADRHVSLGELRDALLALGRFDEALRVVEREEAVADRRPGHLVPNHHTRAKVCEARGDWDGVVREHLAAVAQYEAAPPPLYGPQAPNTELARGWARAALTRAGRIELASKLFPR